MTVGPTTVGRTKDVHHTSYTRRKQAFDVQILDTLPTTQAAKPPSPSKPMTKQFDKRCKTLSDRTVHLPKTASMQVLDIEQN
jgi:hypothetical protein